MFKEGEAIVYLAELAASQNEYFLNICVLSIHALLLKKCHSWQAQVLERKLKIFQKSGQRRNVKQRFTANEGLPPL